MNIMNIDKITLVLIVVSVLLLILIIILYVKLNKLNKLYDNFMGGKNAESLEDVIIDMIDRMREMKKEDRANKDAIRVLNKHQRASYQKTGVVRYNAFKGMGGNLSFALAMLDYTNTGYILNSVHSNEGCYVYVKEVDRGQTELLLGREEKEALEQALGYIKS